MLLYWEREPAVEAAESVKQVTAAALFMRDYNSRKRQEARRRAARSGQTIREPSLLLEIRRVSVSVRKFWLANFSKINFSDFVYAAAEGEPQELYRDIKQKLFALAPVNDWWKRPEKVDSKHWAWCGFRAGDCRSDASKSRPICIFPGRPMRLYEQGEIFLVDRRTGEKRITNVCEMCATKRTGARRVHFGKKEEEYLSAGKHLFLQQQKRSISLSTIKRRRGR